MRLKKTSKLYMAKLMMILVLLSGFCIDTIAQTIISGKVSNQKDNSGIEGISIVIKGTRNGATSDNNGGFSLKLNNNKSKKYLGWRPILSINEMIKFTISWYELMRKNKSKLYDLSISQINYFIKKI